MDKEKKELLYRLIDGEERFEEPRQAGVVSWSRLRARGDARGTILLLHGVASNGSRWEEFVEMTPLRECWDIIRLDLRGHAASVCRDQVGLEEWSDDLKAVLDAAQVKKVIVIGHSLGAQLGMHFATRHAERIQALGLLDPLVSCALTEKARQMKKNVGFLKIAEGAIRAMNRLGFVRSIKRQDLRSMDAEARKKIEKGGEELRAFIEQYSSTKTDLQYIHSATYIRDLIEVSRETPHGDLFKFPVLVIASSAGTFTDESALVRWSQTLPNAQVETVTCAHWPMTECPQEVSSKIERWIGVIK